MSINLKKNFMKTMLSISLVILTTGCEEGLQSITPPSQNGGLGNNDGGGTTRPDNSPIADPSELPNFQLKVEGSTYDKFKMVELDKENLEVIVSMPMPIPLGRPETGSFPNADLEGVYWKSEETGLNQWKYSIHIPLNKFIKDKFSHVNTSTLPNGDSLPQVTGGELPAFALKWTINKERDLYLYLGGGMLAVFIPTYDFDPYFYYTYPLKNSTGQTSGFFITIPEKNSYSGGFYMVMQLPVKISDWVDTNLN